VLASMTGHGQAQKSLGPFAIEVEIRTVNNRFLKVSTKLSDVAAAIELELEGILREQLKRGSVSLSVRVSGANAESLRINQAVLKGLMTQAKRVADDCGMEASLDLGTFLNLPGVLQNHSSEKDEELLDAVRACIREALADLQSMRIREGESMGKRFREDLQALEECCQSISERSPQVVTDYRARLEQRVRTAIEERGLDLPHTEVVREVVLFSDKIDISEELTRLQSHIEQFRSLMDAPESQGRRLDFLLQEMGRETNTIGSKANDSSISTNVVSIKAILEQIRELAQNIE
jgi:uncharacterized protein (TIGR00255 family)